jgi:hypothetical protein
MAGPGPAPEVSSSSVSAQVLGQAPVAPSSGGPVPAPVAPVPPVMSAQAEPAPSSGSANRPATEPGPAPVSEPAPSPVPPASPTAVPAQSEQTAEQGQPVAVPVAVATLPSSDLDSLWAAAHESVRAEHGLLGAVLNEATPVILNEQELTLAFPTTAAFHKRKAEDSANRSVLIETLRRLTGRHYRLEFELREDLPQDGAGNGAPPSEEEVMSRLMAELDAEELPEDWLQQQKGGD